MTRSERTNRAKNKVKGRPEEENILAYWIRRIVLRTNPRRPKRRETSKSDL
jgi:hypothetical protein